MKRQILLIRHGLTAANERHAYCGAGDLPLSQRGREELCQLRDAYRKALKQIGQRQKVLDQLNQKSLEQTSADQRVLNQKALDLNTSGQNLSNLNQTEQSDIPGFRFYSSGMKRTNETLKLLFGEVPIFEVLGMRELDFGDFEGFTYETLKEREDYREWLSDRSERVRCPHGESGQEMRVRVWQAFREFVCSQAGGLQIIVTHGGPIAAILEMLTGRDGTSRYELQPKPGQGRLLTLEIAGPEQDQIPDDAGIQLLSIEKIP